MLVVRGVPLRPRSLANPRFRGPKLEDSASWPARASPKKRQAVARPRVEILILPDTFTPILSHLLTWAALQIPYVSCDERTSSGRLAARRARRRFQRPLKKGVWDACWPTRKRSCVALFRRTWETAMMDLFYVAVTLGFFGITWAFVALCERV